ncbi:MAG: hypothetical protein V1816_19200 [Pseudomonadota bacterium]
MVSCFIGLVLSILVASACTSTVKYSKEMDSLLALNRFDLAYEEILKNKKEYSNLDQSLYYLDLGILAHYAGRFEESNRNLAQAELILDDLYTTSISKESAAMVVNEKTLPYDGEDFERALVNMFMSLNYTALGLRDDALVEARKVDQKLAVINARYPEDKKNVYKEDAFIRYMMGLLYESDGEMNDALISYRKSVDIYRRDYFPAYGTTAPSLLYESLFWAAEAMKFDDEKNLALKGLGRQPSLTWKQKKDQASIIFIHYNGRGPRKVEQSFMFPMPDGKPNRIALPVFKESTPRIAYGKIQVHDLTDGRTYHGSTQLMENLAAIAVLNLENERARLIARAILRAAIQYGLSEGASAAAKEAVGGKDGETVGQIVSLLAGVARTVIAAADLRHWRLLPAEIRAARLDVPPGEYKADVEFMNSYNQKVQTGSYGPLSVRRGEVAIVFLESIQ